MPSRPSRLAPMRSAALLAALTALPAGVALQQAHAGEAGLVPIPAFTPQQLAAAPRDGWYTNGGSLSNQRYSPLDQINRTNVAGLKAVWRASLEGSGLNPRDGNQAQPLVYDGVVYIMTGEGDTFAVDFETGKALWEFKARVDPRVARPCCSWPGRGVAIGDGKVFVGLLDARLVALDQRTGKVVWSVQAEDPKLGYNSRPMAGSTHRRACSRTTARSMSWCSPEARPSRAASAAMACGCSRSTERSSPCPRAPPILRDFDRACVRLGLRPEAAAGYHRLRAAALRQALISRARYGCFGSFARTLST